MPMSVVYMTVNGQLVAENRGGVVTHYVPDPLGSVIATRDAAGNQTSTTEYWPFGEIRTQTGTNPSPWGFCGTWGYYKDVAARLYVRARMYRSDLSRWMTVDPLWPSEKPYSYVDSNPIIEVDKFGLSPGSEFWRCFHAILDRSTAYTNKEVCEYCKQWSGAGVNCESSSFKKDRCTLPGAPPAVVGWAEFPFGNKIGRGRGACMKACLLAAGSVGDTKISKITRETCEHLCYVLRSGNNGCDNLFKFCMRYEKEYYRKNLCMSFYLGVCFGQ